MRQLVTGRYINRRTYVLYNEDGTEFMVIKEGQRFWIDNQLRPWHPIRVPKKNGKGTILMCKKFGKGGKVIEEFPLIHNKRGLWALSSGAARNGVFHNYTEPKTAIEKQLSSMGVSRNVIEKADVIDIVIELGGDFYSPRKCGYGCISDGKEEDLTEPEYAYEDDYEIMISSYQARIYEATYAICYSIDTSFNGCTYRHLERVIITPDADEEKVVEELKCCV